MSASHSAPRTTTTGRIRTRSHRIQADRARKASPRQGRPLLPSSAARAARAEDSACRCSSSACPPAGSGDWGDLSSALQALVVSQNLESRRRSAPPLGDPGRSPRSRLRRAATELQEQQRTIRAGRTAPGRRSSSSARQGDRTRRAAAHRVSGTTANSMTASEPMPSRGPARGSVTPASRHRLVDLPRAGFRPERGATEPSRRWPRRGR